MASNPSALQDIMAQSIIQQIAGQSGGPMPGMGGMSGMGGGMDAGGPEASAALQLSRELSNLRSADPGAMLKALQNLKQQMITIINHTGMSLPGVARNLAKTFAGMDAAIKEAQQAAATASVVSAPMQSSALPPSVSPQDGFAGFPSPTGGM